YFNAVQQTVDGGYVATGEFFVVGQSYPYPTSVLVAAFDPSGDIRWQKGFNNLDGRGSPSGYEHALSGIQTSDGGYLAAGNWSNVPLVVSLKKTRRALCFSNLPPAETSCGRRQTTAAGIGYSTAHTQLAPSSPHPLTQ